MAIVNYPECGGTFQLSEQQETQLTPTEVGRRRSKRANKIIVLACVLLLLMLSLVAQGGFNLSPFFAPETAGETLLLYALSTLNFIAFITLLFILLRNIIKLERERRAGVVGSRFKARLVFYSIALSLLPVVLMFFFAYGLLNRSVDRWFGDPARQMVDDAKFLQEAYYQKEELDLTNDLRMMIRSLSLAARNDFSDAEFENQLKQELLIYNVALIRLITPEQKITVFGDDSEVQIKVARSLNKAEHRLVTKTDNLTDREEISESGEVFFVAGMRLDETDNRRMLIVARKFPSEIARRTLSISEHNRDFSALKEKVRRIKANYTLLLAAVALLLVFSASWLALYFARSLTVPIQALAEATERVAHGDFARPVETVAEDELAALVSSFNQMSRMLAENRQQLECAAQELQRTNQTLEDRRRYIETVLESLSTGVISTDAKTGIATVNETAMRMLALDKKPEIGIPISQISEQGEELAKLCRRAWRSEIAQTEIEFKRRDGSALYTATTAIALRQTKGAIEGWVIVIEDLTNLIQAERAAAWSEVARRMAHEIKNPLTPIQLSAERIMRNYQRHIGTVSEPRFDEVVREGTSTIVREVEALQRMVDEFSRFARLPEAKPVEASLNAVINDAVSLYAERLQDIRIECDLAQDLPTLRIDPEQIKRVMVNLIDNAIEAIDSGDEKTNGAKRNGHFEKLIKIETRLDKEREIAQLVVSDTGHGIRSTDRDKLFLPKFSTRTRGTGLGLAIVSHIITDHKGRIRAEDNEPRGARFVIELPVS
ncbi:MAG: ATP-binding protein [Acidobacteriota bacterium]